MLRITFGIIAILCNLSVSAQEGFFYGAPVEEVSYPRLEEEFKKYDVFQIDAAALNDFVKQNQAGKLLRLQLGDRFDWTFNLYPDDIRSPDYQLLVSTAKGRVVYPKSENKTFGGNVVSAGDGPLRLTIDEHFLYGYFEINDFSYFIEPLRRFEPETPKDYFVIYADKDVKPHPDAICSFAEIQKLRHKKELFQVGEKIAGACYTVEIALAGDFLLFSEFGTVTATEDFMIGVLNNVQTNFDDEFADQIQFQVATSFVSDCSSCDPWTSSTEAGTLLDSFKDWGNSNGFGVNFDVATLWTNRNLNGPTIGVAWVGALCGSLKYNVCEHFSTSANLLRVLQAHELGHNFDALHDAAGSPTIMAPAINNTTQWSAASVSDIDSYVSFISTNPNCFSSCPTTGQPPAAAFIADNLSGCVPLTVNFNDQSINNPTSWQWTLPGGTPSSSTAPNPSVVYNSPGTFDVTLLVSNEFGNSEFTQAAYITAIAAPVANFAMIPQGGATVSFNNLSVNATNYVWDFGDGNFSAQVNPTHTYGFDGVYTVSLSASNGCGTSVSSQQVNIVTPPVAIFSSDLNTGCTPLQVQFSGLTENADSWNWTFEGGNPATSSLQDPVVIYNQAGTFSVTLTVTNVAGQNTLEQTNLIVVDPDAVAGFQFDNILGQTVANFNNTSTNSTNYNWDFGDGATSQDVNPSHDFGTDGIYTVSLIAMGDCADDTTSQEVTIVTPPMADFEIVNASGCVPLQVQFNDLSSDNTTSWNWTFEGAAPAGSTEENPLVTYNQAGTFGVTLVVDNAAGESTMTINGAITAGDGPSAGFVANNTLGETLVNFTNTSSNEDSYNWDFGDAAGSTEENPSHDYQTDGTYNVSLTTTNECGSDTFTSEVTIVTLPQAIFTASAQNGCTPFVVQFTDQSSANSTTWQWTFEGGDPSTSSEQNPQVVYIEPGIYNVTLVVNNAAGESSLTQPGFIEVGQGPVVAFEAINNLGEPVVILFNNSTNADTYLWDFGDDATSTDFNTSHAYPIDGTYSISLTATNECGSKTLTQEVTIVTAPEAGFTTSATEGCLPFEVQFTDQSSVNATNWQWTFAGGNPSTSIEQHPLVVYEEAGTYSVSLLVGNAAGEDVIEQMDLIVVGEEPAAAFGSSNELGQTKVSFSNTSSGADSYLWDFGDGTQSVVVEPVHDYGQDGTYTVTLIVINECGSDTTVQEVTIVTAPEAGFAPSATEGCLPFEVQFTDQSSLNATSWQWTFAGGDPATSTEQHPLIVYNQAGTYSVTLVVGNAAGEDLFLQESFIQVIDLPEAFFSINVNGSNVQFNNNSVGAGGYFWDFGDGIFSEEENPSHSYEEDGSYVVSLTVVNDCGSQTVSNTVLIDSALPAVNFAAQNSEGCLPLGVQFINQSSENAESFEWSFPGGSPGSSIEENPLVIYNEAGVYEVTLIASNANGSAAQTQFELIVVSGPPTAAYEYAINQAAVSFANISEDATVFAWDFGDGNFSSEENPEHNYEAAGIFGVQLIATNECGSDTSLAEVLIEGEPPAVGFSFSQELGCLPFSVNFEDQSSGMPTSWEWAFPGGDPEIFDAQNPVVVYDQAGVYDVSLTVANVFGSTSQTMAGIITALGSPQATIEVQTDGLAVSFTSMASGGNLNYEWHFGDGNSSSEESPVHTYEMQGEYSAQLVVSNICGSDTIEVSVNLIADGAGEAVWLDEFNLFPNPNGGQFTLQMSGRPVDHLDFQLFNLMGQLLYSEKLDFKSGRILRSFRFDRLASGLYLVRLQARQDAVYHKVIVKKS